MPGRDPLVVAAVAVLCVCALLFAGCLTTLAWGLW